MLRRLPLLLTPVWATIAVAQPAQDARPVWSASRTFLRIESAMAVEGRLLVSADGRIWDVANDGAVGSALRQVGGVQAGGLYRVGGDAVVADRSGPRLHRVAGDSLQRWRDGGALASPMSRVIGVDALRPDGSGLLYWSVLETHAGVRRLHRGEAAGTGVAGEVVADLRIAPRVPLSGSMAIQVGQPYGLTDVWAPGPRGVAIVRANPYRVEWVRGSDRVVGPAAEPPLVPIGPDERAAILTELGRTIGRMMGGGGTPSIEQSDWPPVMTPVRAEGVLVDDQERVWVSRSAPLAAGALELDCFGADGRWLRRVRVPRGRLVGVVGDDLLVAIEMNGQERLDRLRS